MAEDPLVQQVIDVVGKPPASRKTVVEAVNNMRKLELELADAVRVYEAQVPPFLAWIRAGKDHFGIYPRFFDPVQPAVGSAERRITDVLHAVARAATGEKKLGSLRHYTRDPRIVASMPAVFAGMGVQEWKAKLKDHAHLDAAIAWYPAAFHHPAPPQLVAVGNRATRDWLMYDLLANRFVVADPWQWRRDVADRFGETMLDDQFVRYFPERATPAQKKAAARH